MDGDQVNLGSAANNDEHETFARQIRAFAQQGDLLLAIAWITKSFVRLATRGWAKVIASCRG